MLAKRPNASSCARSGWHTGPKVPVCNQMRGRSILKYGRTVAKRTQIRAPLSINFPVCFQSDMAILANPNHASVFCLCHTTSRNGISERAKQQPYERAPRMTQLDEAIARYHRILESEPYRDLRWVKNLQEQMEARQLSAGGRLLCPFLRPNFVTQKQYDNLVKTGEALISAVDRMLRMALASPQLLSRMQLFPAEKMLAAIDPGYEMAEVSAQLDLQIQNGSLHVMQYNADALTGAAWSEGLSDIFYDAPPVKEFRRRYNITRLGGRKQFLGALLKAWKMFAGTMFAGTMSAGNGTMSNVGATSNGSAVKPKPHIAILEFRDPTGRSEYEIYRDYFRAEGYQTELVSPEVLEYRNGVLRSGNFDIDLIYRRISAQEFLLRFTLNHPLVQAYRDHKVCIVNSFRSE